MYVCMHACMLACMYGCFHVCMYVFLYFCMYVCISVCLSARRSDCMYALYVFIHVFAWADRQTYSDDKAERHIETSCTETTRQMQREVGTRGEQQSERGREKEEIRR